MHNLSAHQAEVLRYLQTVPEANKDNIYINVSFGYYHNWQKHLGDVLTRMVKAGLIDRARRGIYKTAVKTQLPVNMGLFIKDYGNRRS